MPNPAKPGDQLKVTLSYFHPLEFEEGAYILSLPTEMPPAAIPIGTQPYQLRDVVTTLSSGNAAPISQICPLGCGAGAAGHADAVVRAQA